MSDHRTVVHEALCASDAVRMQATRIFWERDAAILRNHFFRENMAERGLSFPSPNVAALDALVDDALEDIELNSICDARAGQRSIEVGHACLSQPCTLEPGWDVVN